MTREIFKWSVILMVAAGLLYLVIPKYKFMGPNDFAFYRCNIITGEVLAWDIEGQKWVTPTRNLTYDFEFFKSD